MIIDSIQSYLMKHIHEKIGNFEYNYLVLLYLFHKIDMNEHYIL